MTSPFAKTILPTPLIPAVLLAGGKASRMGGGDKSLRLLAGRPLLGHVIQRLKPQVRDLVINANGDSGRFAEFGLPVVPDEIVGQPGPLAGILAGLDWAATQCSGAEYVLSVPTDCPFLPVDLTQHLMEAARSGAEIAIAASNGRLHPVIGLWRVSLHNDMRRAMGVENLRKVRVFSDRYRTAVVNFPSIVNLPGGAADPFFNANTPEDLAFAEGLLHGPAAE